MATTPWVALRSADLSAEIDPQGAQLSVLRATDGRDLLWNGDAAFWSGRSPLLFPIVGALNGGGYRIEGRSFALPRHGFARAKAFAQVAGSASTATFRLTDDAATLPVYPFRFCLDLHYELAAATLTMTGTIHNRGAGQLLASFGYHPAFRWPLPFGQAREAHGLQFMHDEPDDVRRLDAAGLLLPKGFPTPITAARLALADTLFRDDVLILDRLASRSVIYGADSGPRLRIDFPDATYLGLWTKPGAPFICIEPWHGVADPQGFAGEFKDKPGVFGLAPGASFASTMKISLLP